MSAAPDLGVYVHWPYCARICPYCDFNVVRARGGAEPAALARAIIADLEAQARITGPRSLVSVFFGGGTPSLMDPEWAGEIVAAATRLWTAAPDLEVTLEANPTDAEAHRFAAFRDAGVNRLSLGLQSLDDEALRFLGRNHTASEAVRAAQTAARVFPRLSLDLIYARPGQTPQAWTAELRQAIALGAEHLSPYQLTIEAGTAFDRAVRRKAWTPPDDDLAAGLFEATQEVLGDAGFDAYEVSNHALGEAARSRHNLVYWTGRDYVGAGPGAHGRITTTEGRIATLTRTKVSDYIARVDGTGTGFAEQDALSPTEAAEERLLAGLRLEAGVTLVDVAALEIAPGKIAELVELGLLAPSSNHLRATDAGRRVLNRLTAELIL